VAQVVGQTLGRAARLLVPGRQPVLVAGLAHLDRRFRMEPEPRAVVAARQLVEARGGVGVLAHDASMSSKSWVIRAVLPIMMEAEQYLVAESSIARSTLAGSSPRPVILKCTWMRVKTFGSVGARSASSSATQSVTSWR